jgi:2-polyprenyl-3-methyl-5-hydroxy-6-metoxy-1,4-benzoquinol methylase
MFERFKAWLIKQLSAPEKEAAHAYSTGVAGQNAYEDAQHVVPYDENLLERSRTQWHFGDWESLAKLERDTLQHHPDRAKLALLVAAGHLQQGNSQAARQFTRLAQDWGCSKKLISQILISGVHNSLGRIAAIGNQQHRALQHFEKSISIGTPGSDNKLLSQARTGEQLNQINTLQTNQLCLSDKQSLRENYFIKAGYKSRTEYVHYDDLEEEDKWQLEVYLRAYGLMKKNNWNSVVDIGCGSAYKLMKYLGDFKKVGYELPDNVAELQRRYPKEDWRSTKFDQKKEIVADLIICSDVIEHLVDPDKLMSYLELQDFGALILSTPERDICRGSDDLGPPRNPAHQREWNAAEFQRYVGVFFEIEEHAVVNFKQGTQCVVCKKRNETF